jgi:hypothetical protein
VYLSKNKQTSKQLKCQQTLSAEELKLSTIFTKTMCPLPGNRLIGPRPQVCNKSKDKEQQKATFLLMIP